jgi:hypothetical protein
VIQDAQAAQEPHRVRRENQPGPDLLQLGGLFVHDSGQAAPPQEGSRGNAAGTAANDGDPWLAAG